MILPVTVILAYFALSVHGKKLHEHMTKEEIESVFNVKHDSIHQVNYDVVPIFHAVNTTEKDRVKRSYSGSDPIRAYIKSPHQQYFLYLVDNNVLLGTNTPIYLAKFNRYDGSIYYTPKQYKDYFPESLGLYQDYENRASMVVETDANNNRHFNGMLGESIQIRSIPDRLHSELKRNYSALLETSPDLTDLPRDLIMDDSTYHIIINKNNNTMDDARINSNNNNILGQQNMHDQLHTELKGDSTASSESWFGLNQPGFGLGFPSPFNYGIDEIILDQEIINLEIRINDLKRTGMLTAQQIYDFDRNLEDLKKKRDESFKDQNIGNWNFGIDKRFDNGNNKIFKAPVNQPETKTRQPPHTYENTKYTVYPEILVAVDYETFELHGKDIKTVAKYMAAFWNAVDLRYREFQDPEVRLNIAGLIISEDSFTTPYMTNSSQQYGDYYMSSSLLKDTNIYFTENLRNKFSLGSYDLLVAMIPKKMAAYNKEGKLEDNNNGRAYLRGACSYERSAVVKDLGGFDGIKPAAHELGHLLGTDHDPKNSYNDCDWNNGFMMSYELRDHTLFRWSRCSKAAIKEFFNSESAYCLKNKPKVGATYPEILPGTLQSRDKQCLQAFGTYAINEEAFQTSCVQLWCQNPLRSEGGALTSGPPAEGTPCGQSRICLDGYCVEDSPAYHSNSAVWKQ